MERQVYFVGAVGGGITRLAGDSHLDVACGHVKTMMHFEGYRPGEHGPVQIEVDDMAEKRCRVRAMDATRLNPAI